MKGQVFTIAKLHYVNGVVYFIARANSTSLDALAENAIGTTKSGTAKHPKTRVRTLVRFAEGLGLLTRPSKEIVQITGLGRNFYEAREESIRNQSKYSLYYNSMIPLFPTHLVNMSNKWESKGKNTLGLSIPKHLQIHFLFKSCKAKPKQSIKPGSENAATRR